MRLFNTDLRIEGGIEVDAIDISKDGGQTWEHWFTVASHSAGAIEKFNSAINFLLSSGYGEYIEPGADVTFRDMPRPSGDPFEDWQ